MILIISGKEKKNEKDLIKPGSCGLLMAPAFAQDEVVKGTSVTFSVVSWEDLQKGLKDRPEDHTLDFHLKLAKAMSEMHGGGSKGDQHVMVFLTDATFGYQIGGVEVQVTAIAKTGTEEVTRQLKSMSVDGLPGYGEYFQLSSRGPFVFKVKISQGKSRVYETEFEKIIQ